MPRRWRGFPVGAALPGPTINDSDVVTHRFKWAPTGRSGCEAALYFVAKVAVVAASIAVALGSLVYRLSAILTFGLAAGLMKYVAMAIEWLLAILLCRFTPNRRPYSLPNVLQPDFVLPARPDEVTATMFFARLAYETAANRGPLLEGALRPHVDARAVPAAGGGAAGAGAGGGAGAAVAAVMMTVETGDVEATQAGSHVHHELRFGGFLLSSLDCRRGYDHYDTQAFIGTYNSNIVVVFRGTEPLSLTDWATDFYLRTEPTAGLGGMHKGFKQALGISTRQLERGQPAPGSLYVQLCKRIKELQTDGTAPGAIVYVTGHSLGAALAATFAAHYMRDNPTTPVRAYPYAQPRVGDSVFAAALEAMVAADMGVDQPRRSFRRFVNNNDIVPRVPSALYNYRHEPEAALRLSGGCEAFYIDAEQRIYRLPRGYWSESPPMERFTAARKTRSHFGREPFLRWACRLVQLPLPYGLFVSDHFPGDYAEAIEANTVAPEEARRA